MSTNHTVLVSSLADRGLLDVGRILGSTSGIDVAYSSEAGQTLAKAAKFEPKVAVIDFPLEEGLDLCRRLRDYAGRIYYVADTYAHFHEVLGIERRNNECAPYDEIYLRGSQEYDGLVASILLYLEGPDITRPA
jgi:hypothetical protein